MSASKLPITAIVASHNEASLLSACLDAVAFCDEIVVIDIDSNDDTAAVAEARGARVVRHAWVPIAEQARLGAIAEARNDWLMLRDPDEVVSPALADDLFELFPRLEPDVGIVAAPIRTYFAGRPLAGTSWGGLRITRFVVNRRLIDFPTSVHRRLVRAPGTGDVAIPFDGENAIEHYWVDGYRDFLRKHRRYLTLEGRDRAAAGEITGARSVLAAPFAGFRESFLRERGYRDGLRGLGLSALWGGYRAASELALLRELRKPHAAS